MFPKLMRPTRSSPTEGLLPAAKNRPEIAFSCCSSRSQASQFLPDIALARAQFFRSYALNVAQFFHSNGAKASRKLNESSISWPVPQLAQTRKNANGTRRCRCQRLRGDSFDRAGPAAWAWQQNLEGYFCRGPSRRASLPSRVVRPPRPTAQFRN